MLDGEIPKLFPRADHLVDQDQNFWEFRIPQKLADSDGQLSKILGLELNLRLKVDFLSPRTTKILETQTILGHDVRQIARYRKSLMESLQVCPTFLSPAREF